MLNTGRHLCCDRNKLTSRPLRNTKSQRALGEYTYCSAVRLPGHNVSHSLSVVGRSNICAMMRCDRTLYVAGSKGLEQVFQIR